MENPNEHVETYLADYITRRDPGFAVLVSAPWGAGKTHLIKELIESQGKNAKPLYVSLFGVNSRDDIDLAILQAIAPYGNTALGKLAGKLGRNVVRKTGLTLRDVNVLEILGGKAPQTLIFDDLERTDMGINELFGYLNSFVEHEGKNLILLANEDELWKDEKRDTKEKLIGHTLTVRADVDAALAAMIGALEDDGAKECLTDQQEIVKRVFEQSATNNLRVLGQCLWDFERLFKVLKPEQKERAEGMQELLAVFLALSVEYKSGGLERADMRWRGAVIFDVKKHPKQGKLIDVARKYSGEGIQYGRYNSVVSTDLAISLICDGWVAPGEINGALMQTRFFALTADEAEWQTVWWARHREEEDVAASVKAMEVKFAARDYHDPGVMLHVFSNRLQLPEMRFLVITMKEVEKECLTYIDDLAAAGNLPAFDPAIDWREGYGYSDTGYLSLGFPRGQDNRAKNFQRLYKYMQETQKRLFEEKFPQICRDLLREMDADVENFKVLLSQSGSKETHYLVQPVLVKMDVGAFVDKLLVLEIEAQEHVFETLKERYDMYRLELVSEHDWFRSIHKELASRLPDLSPFLKFRTQEKIDHYLKPIIDSWNEMAEGEQ